MRLRNRKSKLHRLLDTVNAPLHVSSGNRFSGPSIVSGAALKNRLPSANGSAVKAGVIAAGVAGLTATSAGISSLRRRSERQRGDS